MPRIFRLFLAVVAVASMAACQTEAPEQTGATEETAVDNETVQQVIESNNDRFEQAAVAGDAIALAGLFTTDGVVMAPNMPRAEGTEAIGAFWDGMMAEGAPETLTLTTDRVIVADSGDLAVELGTYTMGGTTPDGVAWEDTGKYTVSWQDVDGEWKIASDAWSSDAPPMGMEGAGEDTPPPAEEAEVTGETL